MLGIIVLPGHIGGELFKYMTGTDIVHVPYKGGAPATADLIAGNVELMFESTNSISPHVRAGRVRARCRPWQAVHGSVTSRPVPSHWPQGRLTLKNPCWKRSWPDPLQLGQLLIAWGDFAPLPPQSVQSSHRGILSLASLP